VDDYRWLREKPNPEVAQYLEAENAYTDAVMKPTEALQKKLYDEMVSHIKETDVNVPYKDGDYFIIHDGKRASSIKSMRGRRGAWRPRSNSPLTSTSWPRAKNSWPWARTQSATMAPCLAYSTDNTGFRQYRLHVRDLRTGKDLPDTAEKTGAIVWAADNQTLFYTVEDPAKRQYRLYRHKLGTDTKNDNLVYEEKDERFDLGAGRTRSRKYILLESGSHTTSEVRYLDAATPSGEWKLIAPREQGIEYDAEHIGDQFYIRTNDKGRNFRLVTAPVSNPGKKNWEEIIPVRDSVMLSGVQGFQDFYVLVERENGLPQLTIVNLANGTKQRNQLSRAGLHLRVLRR